jgi:hypothetical protein
MTISVEGLPHFADYPKEIRANWRLESDTAAAYKRVALILQTSDGVWKEYIPSMLTHPEIVSTARHLLDRRCSDLLTKRVHESNTVEVRGY